MKKILILSANPKGTTPLRLSQEVREIHAGLERAMHRDRFVLEQKWAVRPRDIQRAMLDLNPSIVHFSGHGMGDEGLVFEDETGSAKLVDGEALAGLFGLFAEQVECVVLNSCYSEVQASAIAQHINYVIGMKKAIGDRAAIEFAVGFYDALGAGRSVEFAHKLGCAAIRLAGIPEQLTPILHKKSNISYDFEPDDGSSFEQEDHYHRLQKLLKAEAWLEADKETTAIILKVSGQERGGWLELEDIKRLPCRGLYILNHLWLKYSNGRFGFSVQRRIWEDIQVTEAKDYLITLLYGNEHVAYAETYKYFSDRIGWHSLNCFLDYDELIFTREAPEGHLPFFGFFKPFWRTRIFEFSIASALFSKNPNPQRHQRLLPTTK
ncbi:GUN4 domain-containing protein [Scytonema hofmannii FACHB-248]|uniref:GUN4 domain-containing protein n=1 Tax=Scytonema hofmannii FACHB-248 TaxID=1842502 RepID=A0ABR8GV07_9CYAN|nr:MULTISPECIES: GUN4 domain-containing protein [Nostocales]MBD2606983.1 GUN4 domain-containing protein [Scytonema hofmannii FACHB-248]